MKKNFSLLILFLLFFMLISIGGVGVSAYTYDPSDNYGLDFTPYKDDIVFCGVDLGANMHTGPWFYAGKNPIHGWDGGLVHVYIKEINPGEVSFQFNLNTDFSPLLESEIRGRLEGSPYASIGSFIKTEYGRDGMYWNPWLQIWQLDYPIDPESIMTAEDWFNYISPFDFGFAYGEIDANGDILIVEEPSHELSWFIDYNFNNGDIQYFEPELDVLEQLSQDGENILLYLEVNYEDFDGYLYWNFEQKYWQVEYYSTTELDYYKQRVDDLEAEISSLEDEISSLEDEISSLEDEIQQLEDEISLLQDEIQQLENQIQQLEGENQQLVEEKQQLEDEIQQLEDALDLEYDRGYNDGYEIGYSEGLLVKNNDIDIIKWFVPLVVIIIVVGIIEPIILCKRRG